MRKTFIGLTACAAALGLAVSAAAVPMSGLVVVTDCTAGFDPAAMGGELYGFQINNTGGGYDDILFDLTQKGGSAVGGAGLNGASFSWGLPDNFRNTQTPNDVVFAIVTFNDGTMTINSGQVATTSGGDQGATGPLAVGAGIPTAWGGASLAQETFTGNVGVQFNAPVFPEVNTNTYGGVPCKIGGTDPDPNAGANGILLGYNVWRIPDSGSTPTPADYLATMMDADPSNDAWQYMVPINFDFSQGDTGGEGMDAPADPIPTGDLAGFNNPDMTAFSADDALIFQDSASVPAGTGRCCGTAPVDGTTYWYAIQPVVNSGGALVGALDGMTFGSAGGGNGTGIDMNSDGTFDAVDLDGDGSADFISPQAAADLPGFGLTNGGLPLLSDPIPGSIDPAAAMGSVEFEGEFDGGEVSIQFTTALEAGNVAGFNVFRHHGDVRVPVNVQPIVATGGEGSVYTLVDDLGQVTRRLRRGGTFEYTVDVLYNDGTPTRTVGPFSVELGTSDSREAPTRRQR